MAFLRPDARPTSAPRLRNVLFLVTALALAATAASAQIDAAGGQLLAQGSGTIPGSPQVDDRFGSALAAGDFDHDGRLDLAIGVPNENVPPTTNSGQVIVVYGSATGLAGSAAESWSANDFAALGQVAASGDRFGTALAVGDFDDDGYDDLAISAPHRRVTRADGSIHDAAGMVFVLYGSAGGLTTARQQVWRQGFGGLAGVAEAGDRLGEALAVGDLDGDGFDDLAIGVPYEDVGATVDAGGVNVLHGSLGGLTTGWLVNPVWTQGSFGFQDETGDHFGAALAIGDFSGDGAADLAIGVPDEDLTGAVDGGSIFLVRGLPGSGLTATGAQALTQSYLFLPGLPALGERFGAALAAGDYDGDGLDDLAMGAPGERWVDGGGVEHVDVGAVFVLRGSAGGGLLGSGAGRRILRADVGTVAGLDRFGAALAAGDFDSDGIDELAVGAPGAAVGAAAGAGAVYLLSRPDLSTLAATLELSQAGAAPGAPNNWDGFGSSLAVGDFDGSRFADLAVGVPFENSGAIGNAGAVNVFWSTGLFRDGFESGNTAVWSAAVGD